MRRLLDVLLFAIFAVSVAALFLVHEDPFARKAVCTYVPFCPHLPHAKPLHKIIYDLAAGSLVTLFFYVLVVRWPDYQRRRRLKDSLERQYKQFRQDCIEIMLSVADGTHSGSLAETLMEQDKFRDYFSENVAPWQNRWHVFLNKLDEYHLNQLLMRMEIFREELSFILNNTDIPKDEPFKFLKRLSIIIYTKKDVTLGYDEVGPLAGFLWEVFAGWGWVKGYQKEDIIKNMIDAI